MQYFLETQEDGCYIKQGSLTASLFQKLGASFEYEKNIKTRIKANLLCPRAVDTNFRDKIMPGENKSSLLSTKAVAKKILEITSKSFQETGKIIDIQSV